MTVHHISCFLIPPPYLHNPVLMREPSFITITSIFQMWELSFTGSLLAEGLVRKMLPQAPWLISTQTTYHSLLHQSQVPPPHPHWNPQEREEVTFPPAGWWHGTSGIYYEDMGLNTLVHRNKVTKDGQTLRGRKKKKGCGLPARELTLLEDSLYWQMRPEFKPLI